MTFVFFNSYVFWSVYYHVLCETLYTIFKEMADFCPSASHPSVYADAKKALLCRLPASQVGNKLTKAHRFGYIQQ